MPSVADCTSRGRLPRAAVRPVPTRAKQNRDARDTTLPRREDAGGGDPARHLGIVRGTLACADERDPTHVPVVDYCRHEHVARLAAQLARGDGAAHIASGGRIQSGDVHEIVALERGHHEQVGIKLGEWRPDQQRRELGRGHSTDYCRCPASISQLRKTPLQCEQPASPKGDLP